MSQSEVIDAEKERLRLAIQKELSAQTQPDAGPVSSEYVTFKHQYMPRTFTTYEKLCSMAAMLSIKPDAKESERYQVAINRCHLNVTPAGAYSLAIIASGLTVLIGLFFSFLLPLLLGGSPSIFFLLTFSIVGISFYVPIKNIPFGLAESWRLRASNQMVLCMFYITTYMRQSSNLERAVDFAADHIGPPLSLDLKRLIWEVQTEKASSIAEALDRYLAEWKESNLEFVEAMNLVQGSLYETSQERRLHSLEKAMDIMLEETYEKMLHYAQNLKSPMTMLHMLGIILPILGLVILPLAVSFIDGVAWYHLFVLYNVLLPAGVYYLGRTILADRPTGYGSADITEINPSLRKFQDHIITNSNGTQTIRKASTEGWMVGILLVLIGCIPLILHIAVPSFDVAIDNRYNVIIGAPSGDPQGVYQLLAYRLGKDGTSLIGPFGLGAAVLSVFVTLGFGLGLARYYSIRTRELVRIRNDTKQLEQEFAGALFQLGNRLGDGIPVELAFSKVAEVMAGTKSGSFFEVCAVNVQKMGMSPERAIFDSERGAIRLYPSALIESSMKVLVESSRKGPTEASLALINMSNYVKEIHRVDERLKDLMADIISGMKSQISFLTPAIAGIVIGITSMITTILGQLQDKFAEIGDTAGAGASAGGVGGLTDLLGLGIPTFHFQIVVGLYVVQITWILAYLVNGIENGEDKLNCQFEQARGLVKATGLYCGISLVVMLLFNIIAGTIMGGTL